MWCHLCHEMLKIITKDTNKRTKKDARDINWKTSYEERLEALNMPKLEDRREKRWKDHHIQNSNRNWHIEKKAFLKPTISRTWGHRFKQENKSTDKIYKHRIIEWLEQFKRGGCQKPSIVLKHHMTKMQAMSHNNLAEVCWPDYREDGTPWTKLSSWNYTLVITHTQSISHSLLFVLSLHINFPLTTH